MIRRTLHRWRARRRWKKAAQKHMRGVPYAWSDSPFGPPEDYTNLGSYNKERR